MPAIPLFMPPDMPSATLPTAHNLQPQRIFVIRTPEMLEKADGCTAAHFHPPVILVVAYDPEAAWKRETDGKNHGEIDAAIAATQMMLQAADLGLGTTYVGMFEPEKLLAAFPEMAGLCPIAMLPLGYPAEGANLNLSNVVTDPGVFVRLDLQFITTFFFLMQGILQCPVFLLQTLHLLRQLNVFTAGILAILYLSAQDGQLLAELAVLLAQIVGSAGQLIHLGLILFSYLLNIGDNIFPIKAAEHPGPEIYAHSILRLPWGLCRKAAGNSAFLFFTIAQTLPRDKQELILKKTEDFFKKCLHFVLRHGIMFKSSGMRHAPLAQLDRASGYGPEGRGFESLTAYQKAPEIVRFQELFVFLCMTRLSRDPQR